MSRRERMRENTREEIKEIARQQMATMGAALLSLNSIAREMEMTTPGLYRYFASREDLITALVVDAQHSFKATLDAAIAPFPETAYADRLLVAMLTYREWAITHPVEYQLVACEPIPDYQVPLEIRSITGVTIFGIFLDLLQQADDAGCFTRETSHPPVSESAKVAIPFPMPTGKQYSAATAYQGVGGWYRMHGFIMLEMFHHLDFMVSDMATYYRHEIIRLLRSNGIEPTL